MKKRKMKDLSKEENLERRIYLLEEASENKKWKRTKITFFVLSAVVYFIFIMSDRMNSLADVLGWIIVAPICAGFIMFVSVLVTAYMSSGATLEIKEIAKLQGELNAIKFGKTETIEIKRKLKEYKELAHGLRRIGELIEIIIEEYRDFESYEDCESEDEKNELLKYKLDGIKDCLKMIEIEYKLYRIKEIFEEDEKWNKE